jgi:hypothetical protein
MKELDPPAQDNTQSVSKQHAARSKGAWHIPTGLKVWQIDPETEIPEEVKVKAAMPIQKNLGKVGDKEINLKQTALKVEVNPMFFYCKAINPKNALRKFHKSPFYAALRHRKQTPGTTS